MGKIFFKNLGRSLLTSLVVLIVAGFFTMVVMVVCKEMLSINLSVLAIMITAAILAFIVSVVWLGLAGGLHWEWFYSGMDDVCDKPPHLVFGCILLLIPFILFGGASVILACTGYEKLVTAVVNNDNYNFLILLFPPIIVSQLCFFIAMLLHYGKWQICWHCGRMFCLDYYHVGSESWDSTSYKTYKTQEDLGSVSIGDRKIFDVKANIEHGYTETWRHTRADYTGTCCHCYHKKANSEFSAFKKD